MFHNKFHNKFLIDIYKSVKSLDKNRMNRNTTKINNIVNKLRIQYGGTKESDEDVQNIMENLGLIESKFLEYFSLLQKYVDIYLKNATEFEKLLKDKLSLESLESLKKSMHELNSVLSNLK